MTFAKTASLKTNPNNPRSIRKDKLDKLVESLKQFPEMLEARPIVVDKDGVVLGGNMRLKAAQLAGLTEVPIFVREWNPEKDEQFVIKDNVSFGEWDWDVLANEWEVDELQDWGMDLPIVNERLEAIGDGQPEITVTEEILEEHNYIVFTFDNQLDWQVAKEIFDIGTVAKPGFTETYMQKGIGRVRKGIELLEKFNKR